MFLIRKHIEIEKLAQLVKENTMKKINARDCKIVTLKYETVKSFLKKNHLQGFAEFIVAYGLYSKNELVQLMSFGKPRFNKNFQWEIIRDCTKINIQVLGGTSRLWKHFLENNNVKDCICYSYPHDTNSLYANKYVDYCGFQNLKKAKPAKKIYFEGIWNDKLKRIDKSILERHGVDRLLGGSHGQDRNNEQILLDLGFDRKEEDGFDPQVDFYFVGGCVYRMEIVDTDKFYIGQTLKDIKKYWGSGGEWNRYLDENNIPRDDEHIRKIVLKDDFKNYRELLTYEVEEIQKYCNKDNSDIAEEFKNKCLNKRISAEYPGIIISCQECNGKDGKHRKGCSRYNRKLCPECKSPGWNHKKSCSKYKQPEVCPECNGIGGHHKSSCSRYKIQTACPECGSYTTHKKWCQNYRDPKTCSECGGKLGRHYKTCSKYKHQSFCQECGGINSHKKGCSKYKLKNKPCQECGNLTAHKSTCSHYKSKDCPECGGKGGKHKSSCSKSKKCQECGNIIQRHKSSCSKYKKPTIKTVCSECGGQAGHHKISCSLYKKNKVCLECGSPTNHKKTCSKYKEKTRKKF